MAADWAAARVAEEEDRVEGEPEDNFHYGPPFKIQFLPPHERGSVRITDAIMQGLCRFSL